MAQWDELPSAKRAKFNFEESITVSVGEGEWQHSFSVYKDAITRRSSFFRSACAERWNTAKEQKAIQLPEFAPGIFSIYLQCIYYDEVVIGGLIADGNGVDDDDKNEQRYLKLFKTHHLADYLGDLQTANMVVEEIVKVVLDLDVVPDLSIIAFVYGSTAAPSPLRRLIVDIYTLVASTGSIKELVEEHSGDIPQQFLCDMMVKKAELEFENDGELINDVFSWANLGPAEGCTYHLHDDSTTCSKAV